MAKSEAQDIYQGPQATAHRSIINELNNISTQQFLLANGLQPGMKVLDIGCGLGVMANWIAEYMDSGSVVAVDTYDDYLDIAREIASEEKINNVEFIKLKPSELKKLDKDFDFIYSRFFLVRLNDPASLLKTVYNMLKPNGIFACESIILGQEYCYPESNVFYQWRHMNEGLLAAKGKDPKTGMKLFQLMQQTGFAELSASLYQPVLATQEQRHEMLYNDLVLQHDNLIKAEIASEGQLNNLYPQIEELCNDDTKFIAYSQSCQVAGIRPE